MDINKSIITHFGKVVGKTSKKDTATQYNTGLKMLQCKYHEKLADVETAVKFCDKHGLDKSEYLFEIINLSRAICDIINGKPTRYLAKLDTKQSGMTIQASITRCRTALSNLGYLTNENIDFYTMFASFMPGMNREQMKDLVMPHFYGAVAEIVGKLGPEKAAKFFEAYNKAVPKPAALGQAFIDCWDEEATEYWWDKPDGSQVHIVIPETFQGKVYDDGGELLYSGSETTRIQWKNSRGESKYCWCYYPKPGTLAVGELGYKALGANAIQGTDAYLMAELGLRCNYSNEFRAKFNSLKRGNSFIGFENRADADKVLHIYQCWQEMGVCSLRVLKFMPNGAVIPSEYYDAIAEAVCNCPAHSFRIMAVHDEFMCHLKYLDEMQKAFNLIVTEIYKGNMLNYWSDVFNWEKYGIQMELDAVDPEIVKALANSSYMLQ